MRVPDLNNYLLGTNSEITEAIARLEKNKVELRKLIIGVSNIFEVNKGTVLPEPDFWKTDSQYVAQKIEINSLSVLYLLDGTKPVIPEISSNIDFTDFQSIVSIVRSTMESYLTFSYVYFDPNAADEEKQFRKKLWHLSALSQRQRFYRFSQTLVTGLTKEKDELKIEVPYIIKSPYYQANVSERAKKSIALGGNPFDWKPDGGYGVMAHKAGINSRWFDDIYNHLSSVSHSEEVINGHMSQDPRLIQQTISALACSVLNVVLSYFIEDNSNMFPKVREWLDKEPVLKQIIDINRGMIKDYDKLKFNES